jgi:hypothetical protein
MAILPDAAATPALPVAAPRLLKAAPGPAGAKGRGLFAVAPIARGELIDENCTLDLDEAQCTTIEPTPAGDHYFAHPADDTRGLLVLGYASLSNHADDPSADTGFRFDERLGWIVMLTARHDIGPGEEITRRYACPPWFEVSG